MPEPLAPGDWDGLNALLARYAATINKQRRRIEALEQVLAPSTVETPKAKRGVFVPRSTCIYCGAEKPSARTALSCSDCARRKQRSLQGKEPRDWMLLTACVNCGRSSKPTTSPLCHPCSASFRKWKDRA